MGDTRVFVNTLEDAPEWFGSVGGKMTEDTERELEMVCDENPELMERIRGLSETATHIVRVLKKDELMTFGYLNVNPAPDYVELILLCGRYKIRSWKGSELVVDKAIEIARTVKAKEIRLEALNQDLVKKVYKPMGFVSVDETEPDSRYLKLPLPPEYGGGKNPGEEVMANNPKFPGLTSAQIADVEMSSARQQGEQQKLAEATAYGKNPQLFSGPRSTNYGIPSEDPKFNPGKSAFNSLLNQLFKKSKTIDDVKTMLKSAPQDTLDKIVFYLDNTASDIEYTVLLPDKQTIRDALESAIHAEANARAGKGGRRSRKLRLNVKRRGTKRHGRSGKHRKLRKLTTRRR